MAITLSGLTKIWKDRRGQDTVEYALIASMAACGAVAIVPAVVGLSEHLVAVLESVTKVLIQAAVE